MIATTDETRLTYQSFRANASLGPAPAMPTIDCDKKRALIVDDEIGIATLLRRVIEQHFPDLAIDTAADGIEAICIFGNKHHSLLVMDINMPKMDGITAFRKIEGICEDRKWVAPEVVFCTGSGILDSLRDILSRHPGHRLLRKPFSVDTILRAINPGM